MVRITIRRRHIRHNRVGKIWLNKLLDNIHNVNQQTDVTSNYYGGRKVIGVKRQQIHVLTHFLIYYDIVVIGDTYERLK